MLIIQPDVDKLSSQVVFCWKPSGSHSLCTPIFYKFVFLSHQSIQSPPPPHPSHCGLCLSQIRAIIAFILYNTTLHNRKYKSWRTPVLFAIDDYQSNDRLHADARVGRGSKSCTAVNALQQEVIQYRRQDIKVSYS